jgi:hypothetical protein
VYQVVLALLQMLVVLQLQEEVVAALVGINSTVVHQRAALIATAHQCCYTVLDQLVHNLIIIGVL